MDLLENDVRRGWHKLAVRHALLLKGIGGATVPVYLTAYCEIARRRCNGRELERIEEAVDTWVSMVSVSMQPADTKSGFDALWERRSP